jgi:O-acetyl-ADP-ribose deacetylase
MTTTRHKITINHRTLELVQGDIIHERADAIVNAANASLLGGGGVDGAIHRAAGPELIAETHRLGGCETGNARITGGYRLPARYIIHAVGPIYRAGDEQVARLLASAYRRSMEIAADHDVTTLAFPAISTGIYGYPLNEAADIALAAVCDFLRDYQTSIQRVRFVLFTDEAFEQFIEALARLVEQRPEARYIR